MREEVDEEFAKALLRAVLDLAAGCVGHFIPIAEVVAAAGRGGSETEAVLDVLATRRWVHVRDGSVAATRWGLEFAMDWTDVETVLRAIVNSAGGIGRPACKEVVIAASGLTDRLVEKLISELSMLELAHHCLEQVEDGGSINAAYITRTGWDYLNNGGAVEAVGTIVGEEGGCVVVQMESGRRLPCRGVKRLHRPLGCFDVPVGRRARVRYRPALADNTPLIVEVLGL